MGTRLQDFTTGSWTAFAPGATLIGLNAARHDAAKHLSLPVMGDAKLGLAALSDALAAATRADGLDALPGRSASFDVIAGLCGAQHGG